MKITTIEIFILDLVWQIPAFPPCSLAEAACMPFWGRILDSFAISMADMRGQLRSHWSIDELRRLPLRFLWSPRLKLGRLYLSQEKWLTRYRADWRKLNEEVKVKIESNERST